VDEPADADPLNLPPINWGRILRWLFLTGLSLWVLAGAVGTVFLAYFATPAYSGFDPGFYTGNAGGLAVAIAKASITVESIAFKLWIASGVLLALLWLRARSGDVNPPPSN
jgi:uncharacterized membrane protein